MPTKILAIDDSKTMRLAIKITFAAEDADVTSVSKGSEAVARAKQMGADVVLVDATLADGEPSGYDVCKALKSDAATARIPVLVMVSNQTGHDAGKLAAAGADGWIAKPFDSQELIDKVSTALGKPTAKPAVAAAAARPAVQRPVASPAPAAKPAVPKIASAPVPGETARPAAAAKVAPAPVRTPAAKPVSRPAAAPAPAAARPTAAPTKPAVRPAAAAPAAGGADIPIAIPIPFTAADAPTPGIVQRLQQAGASGGALAGIDPKVAEVLASLSREVIEAVVWEVVPELAEQMIKQQQARTA